MRIDISTLKPLFDFLHEQMIKQDSLARKKCFSRYAEYYRSISNHLVEEIVIIQKNEALVIKKLLEQQTSLRLQEEKQNLLLHINKVLNNTAHYMALMQCVLDSFKNGFGHCQEHASLVSLALLKLNGVNCSPVIENICIQSKNSLENHEVVVLNRNDGSDIQDPRTWGEDCLVIDSSNYWVEKIHNIPEGTALHNILKLGVDICNVNISVLHQNDMELNLLTQFKENPEHPFHRIEKMTFNCFMKEVTDFVEKHTEMVLFPTLYLEEEECRFTP